MQFNINIPNPAIYSSFYFGDLDYVFTSNPCHGTNQERHGQGV
ncbi:hypothetical protein SAMN06265218_1223 [Fodinibius sediminis]|uniref:Uncharacterized protein n=1 Tax=Fodinibius sediminis TaxID=1214077 RepID=A0A521F2G3_9BACT|nr:hypothetical protein SAMN06265218_1223 [Fodinibius sediminis]